MTSNKDCGCGSTVSNVAQQKPTQKEQVKENWYLPYMGEPPPGQARRLLREGFSCYWNAAC